MQNIKLSEVRPGMILARDVKGRFGRGLLLSGNMITEKHIKIFKSWGIAEITVEQKGVGGQESSGGYLSAPVKNEQELKKIKKLFQFNDIQHPAVKELFQEVLRKTTILTPQEESS
ncbi:MAG: hypothetical protein OEZ51_09100 [Nitrospinota bacterium]|nr:hypothetical protein [Nitrospinota bacterium]